MVRLLKLESPELYDKTHVAAYDFFRQQLGDYPTYIIDYVPELVYHRLQLAHLEPLEPQAPTLQVWWQQSRASSSRRWPRSA